MAHRQTVTRPDNWVHSNRICKLDKAPGIPNKGYSITDSLKPGQLIKVHKHGEVEIEAITYEGNQPISVLVPGTAGRRRETIFPLHIIALL